MSVQNAIAFIGEQKAPEARKPWPTIGKGWKNDSGGISIVVGMKSKDRTTGVLTDQFESVTIAADSRLYLQPNGKKRAGKKDADFFMKLVEGDKAQS